MINDRYLFRAYNPKINEWLYDEHPNGFVLANTAFSSEQSDWVIMQCTGLKDKNGKRIFEGDILLRSNTNPVKIIVSIEKTNIGFRVAHRELTKNKLYSFCDRCEIIGNIYDNPELLEVQHENI